MKNLKKFLAVLVVVAIMATTMVSAFAADTISADAQICKDLGILKGSSGVDADYLAKGTQRLQAAILTLRLMGKESTALAFAGTSNFKDAKDVTWVAARNVMAYLKQNPEFGWKGGTDGTFAPNGAASATHIYKVILELLGYRQGIDFEFANVLTFAEAKGLVKIKSVTTLTNNDVATALVEGLKTTVAAGNQTLAEKLVAAGIIKEADAIKAGLIGLKVMSVTPINATQIVVKFSKAVLNDTTNTNVNRANLATKYTVDGVAVSSAVVQADGVTVLLTVPAALSGTKLVVVNPVAAAANTTELTAIYTYVMTYTDTVAPAVAKIEYPTFDKAAVTFSEPMTHYGIISVTQDGAVKPVSVTWDASMTILTFDLANAAYAETKPITVVFVGAADKANNLIAPNPTTITLTKIKSDTAVPTVASVTAVSNKTIKVVFSEKLSTTPAALAALVTAGNPTSRSTISSFTTDDSITFTGTLNSAYAGVGNIKVAAGFADMSGNVGVEYTSGLLQFTADLTKPVLAGTEVKVIGTTPYLVFKYNEDVTTNGAVSITGSRVQDYVSYSVSTTGSAVAYLDGTTTDAKAVMVDITALTEGAYTVTFGAGLVKDASNNASDAASVTFTRGTVTTTDTTAPTVNAIPVITTSNDFMTVVFSEAMDPATALNVNNYKVGGATIFSAAIFDANANTVKLTVIPGTIVYGGAYSVAVSGAKDKAGNVMTAYTNTLAFVKENVKPTIASAALTNTTTITVTFSENVTLAANSFEVYKDAVLLTSVANAAVTTAANTVTITIPTVDDLTKNYTVKLINSSVVDTNGNVTAQNGTIVTVTK